MTRHARNRPQCIDYRRADSATGSANRRRSNTRKPSRTKGASRLDETATSRQFPVKLASGVATAAACGYLVFLSVDPAGVANLLPSMPKAESTPETTAAGLSVKAAAMPPIFYFSDAADALSERLARSGPDNRGGSQTGTQPPVLKVDSYLQGTDETASATAPLPGVDGLLALQREMAAGPADAIRSTVVVKPGDSLVRILGNQGVKSEQLTRLLEQDLVKQNLSNLRVNQEIEFLHLPNGKFHSASMSAGRDREITLRTDLQGMVVASIADLPIEKRRVVTSGTIEQSLYLAAEEIDLKQSTIMSLANIFQWELDFARDIRSGDHFSIVYDQLFREGEYIGDGEILAAEFTRGPRTYRAFRFTTDDGKTAYYAEDGRSKQRTFMRHPVDVVRITSQFNPNRLHPVLKERRAHRGVDYGSPHGAPIYATADGVVKFSGVRGGYGNTVELRHGDNISTLYAHMSRISDKSIVGQRVRQGDVIGYVGRTGRVTGTHLHYEFRVSGMHVDPLKVQLPEAAPLAASYQPELRRYADNMLEQMHSVLTEDNTQLAGF